MKKENNRWLSRYPIVVKDNGERCITFGDVTEPRVMKALIADFPDSIAISADPDVYKPSEILDALQGELENYNRHQLMRVVDEFYDNLAKLELDDEEVKAVLLAFGDAYFGSFI